MSINLNGAVICDSVFRSEMCLSHGKSPYNNCFFSEFHVCCFVFIVCIDADVYIWFIEGWGAHSALIYQWVLEKKKKKKRQMGFLGLVKFSHDWPLEWSEEPSPVPADTEICWCPEDKTGPTPSAQPHSQTARSTLQSSLGSLFLFFCSKISLLWYLKRFQVTFSESVCRAQFRFTG